MRIRLLIIVVLSFYFIESAFAQLSEQDTVLYLLHEPDKHFKYTDTKGVNPVTLKESWEDAYTYHNLPLYDGIPLSFISIDKINRIRLQPSKLEKLPIVTDSQLYEFIAKIYPKDWPSGYKGSGAYFRRLKHIYIVERNTGTGTPTVTEVRILGNFE